MCTPPRKCGHTLPVLLPAVVPVFGYLVDEEKAQGFDAPGKEHPLFFKMSPDGFPNLNTPNGGLGYVAHGVTGVQNLSVGEFHRVADGVNLGDDEPSVLIQPV